jgi:hypothetical protein
MVARFLRIGVIASLALLTLAVPAEAFGRRQASVCYTVPVYTAPHSWCCPCPPPVVIPTGLDCVCNHTDHTLRVHISSGFGHVEALVPPKQCFYFYFRKDNMKPRFLTAFTLDNDLVAHYDFAPLDQNGLPHPACLWITGTTAAPTKTAPQRQKAEGSGPHHQVGPLNGHAII